MKLEYLLAVGYIVFGLMNTYCFLFQRTTRKIRQYAIGTQGIGLENNMLPDWYFWLHFSSLIRFIPLIWLLFVSWELALGLTFSNWVLKMKLPVDDYGNIQKLKSNLFRKKMNGTFTEEDSQFEEWIIQAEIKSMTQK